MGELIKRDIYVDDKFSGAHSTDEAAQLTQTVTKQLEKHGMILRKLLAMMYKSLKHYPQTFEKMKKVSLIRITQSRHSA